MGQRRVGDLVFEQPGLSRIFQKHGIDFCCQGSRTVAEACTAKGVSLDTVIAELGLPPIKPAGFDGDPAELPPDLLASHIIAVHHEFLRAEMPRLRAMAERVARVHGGHTPSLLEVREVFHSLATELEDHLAKEEQILFPAISLMTAGWTAPMPLDGPLSCMEHEHADAHSALSRLRVLTNGFVPPEGACNTYRALFAGLADLEADLLRHIQLEDTVLFPAARRMAGDPDPSCPA